MTMPDRMNLDLVKALHEGYFWYALRYARVWGMWKYLIKDTIRGINAR
jgi:hypothetical protein